jgi:hypothetical protein
MVEQMFNGVQARGMWKRVSKKMSKSLVDIFRNKWRHNHLLYQVLSKMFTERPHIKGL